MTEVEMVEMLGKAIEQGVQMQKTSAQFHDLIINASKDRLKQAKCNASHKSKPKKKPVVKMASDGGSAIPEAPRMIGMPGLKKKRKKKALVPQEKSAAYNLGVELANRLLIERTS